jgi:Zn-dependent peptidase ImmA (M78 family)
MEYAANSFAALLLMPESRVREAVNDGMRNIGALADRFGVSSPAMKARVVELGYKLKQND